MINETCTISSFTIQLIMIACGLVGIFLGLLIGHSIWGGINEY